MNSVPRTHSPGRDIALLLAGCLSAAACSAEAAHVAGWTGERTTRGDTVVILSHTPASPAPASGELRISTPSVVWASDLLVRPTQIEQGPDSLLFVVDGFRIFVLGRGGTLVGTLGRRGDGPGEFRRIHGVRFLPPDTLLAWDGNTRRLSWLALDGRLLKSVTLAAPAGYSAARSGRLALWHDSILLPWAPGMVRAGDTPDSLVVAAIPISGDTGKRLLTMPEIQWAHFAGVMAPAAAYAPFGRYALGPANAVAATDGIEACVNLYRPAEPPLQMCRNWTRPSVGPEERTAEPLHRVEPSDQQRKFLTSIVEGQAYPELRNSIRDLMFDTAGNLWARMVDSGATVHPMLAGQFPELRPPLYRWTVFASDGRWMHDVLMPSGFRPLLIEADALWGLVEDENGVPAIARIARAP
ncbi:MAG TPA: hypothetical protein VFS94_12720 [Gemmatimonadales bacterium]|nr:hypothetical protein [Gemmatimonadales bacterium]